MTETAFIIWQCMTCGDIYDEALGLPHEGIAPGTRFADLPEDWRITVDSHSSSPIFADENTQMVFAAQKLGIVDGDAVT